MSTTPFTLKLVII